MTSRRMYRNICLLVLLTLLTNVAHAKGGYSEPETKQKRKIMIMPTSPAGLSRRSQCSAGYYYENGCRTCLAGYYCSGNDSKVQCSAGYYSGTGATSCSPCPLGTWTDQQGTQYSSNCKPVQGGYKANASSGATAQVACGVGYYSAGNTDKCTICPAGSYCNAQTNSAPSPCVPGRYAPSPGAGQDCTWCPQGYFNNVYGATSCCKYCSGWYNDQTSQTHCFNCPGQGSSSQGSPPAATSKDKCTFSLSDYVATCDQDRNAGACPPTQATATASSKVTKRAGRMSHLCPNPEEKRCPVSKGRAMVGKREDSGGVGAFGIDAEIGPYECLDVKSNLESCGGCVAEGEIVGEDGGRDCTAIDHVSSVKCADGQCLVRACRQGYQVSADRLNCVKASKHKHRGARLHGHVGHDF